MKRFGYVSPLFFLVLLWGGCSFSQKEIKPVAPPQSTSTPTITPTTTPGPNDTGSGEIKITYMHTITGGKFNVGADFPFKIRWNDQLHVWEAKSEEVLGSGLAKMDPGSGVTCEGLFAPSITLTSGVIIPPNPLKILGACKMVTNFRNDYDAFSWICNNGVSFANEATSSTVGPVTFNLRIGSRQSASGEPGDAWSSIYEYTITKLSLPVIHLAPYCDTSGSLEQTIP